MSDADWLIEVFREAEKRWAELPEWARPVLVVSAEDAHKVRLAPYEDHFPVSRKWSEEDQ